MGVTAPGTCSACVSLRLRCLKAMRQNYITKPLTSYVASSVMWGWSRNPDLAGEAAMAHLK